MTSRRTTKKSRLDALLRERNVELIDRSAFDRMRQELAPISDRYLRELLRESGVQLAPIVEGVRQDTLDNAARTLTALSQMYRTGGQDDRVRIRRVVIDAKDQIRWAMRRAAPEKRAVKEEMLLWTLTWLENPPAFEAWLALRRRATGSEPIPP